MIQAEYFNPILLISRHLDGLRGIEIAPWEGRRAKEALLKEPPSLSSFPTQDTNPEGVGNLHVAGGHQPLHAVVILPAREQVLLHVQQQHHCQPWPAQASALPNP